MSIEDNPRFQEIMSLFDERKVNATPTINFDNFVKFAKDHVTVEMMETAEFKVWMRKIRVCYDLGMNPLASQNSIPQAVRNVQVSLFFGIGHLIFS